MCDLLSPSTARIDRSEKLTIYARSGVGYAWLIDPVVRTLEVFRLEGARWTILAVHGDESPVRAEPFDAIELSLGELLPE